MKIATVLLVTVFTTIKLIAQDTITNKSILLKVNTASVFRDAIEGSIEKRLNDKSSIEMTIGTSNWNNKTIEGKYDSVSKELNNFQHTVESFSLYNINFQWNYYLMKRKNILSGLYLGPYAKLYAGKVEYQFVTDQTQPYFGKENNVSLESRLFSVAMGGNIGYQFNLNNQFTIGGFVQLGYKFGKATPYFENESYKNEYYSVFTDATVKGFDTNFGINLGFVL